MRRYVLVSAFAVLVSACGGSGVDVSAIPPLEEATPETVAEILANSDKPVVLNVWAAWCIPCRSEAPLLERAAEEFSEDVAFVGINFRDSQARAREFIAEFFPEAPIDHFIDQRDTVPASLGGTFGVPQTFFFAAGGELVAFVPSVIDERTLAIQIDEIIARSR